MARHLGTVFWLPPEHAYTIFLYAYSALFGIPAFTGEAVRRQPDRFSRRRLPHTVRSTTGFILDAFGYDRRMDRPRDVLYWPALVIKSVHDQTRSKERISNPAMAYFACHLIRAAEYLSPNRNDPHFEQWRGQHFAYVGDFFRTAGYPFPRNRAKADAFSLEADRLLAGDEYAEYWRHILHAAGVMNVELKREHLAEFLPPESSRLFKTATEPIPEEVTEHAESRN